MFKKLMKLATYLTNQKVDAGLILEYAYKIAAKKKSERELRELYEKFRMMADPSRGGEGTELKMSAQKMADMKVKYPDIDFDKPMNEDLRDDSSYYDEPVYDGGEFFTAEMEELRRRVNQWGDLAARKELARRGVSSDWVDEIIMEERMLHGLPASEESPEQYGHHSDYDDRASWQEMYPSHRAFRDSADWIEDVLAYPGESEQDDYGYTPSDEEVLKRAVTGAYRSYVYHEGIGFDTGKGERIAELNFDRLIKEDLIGKAFQKFQTNDRNTLAESLRDSLYDYYSDITRRLERYKLNRKATPKEIEKYESQLKRVKTLWRITNEVESEVGGSFYDAYKAQLKSRKPWSKG